MSKIIIESKIYNEIPYNEYYDDCVKSKGLVFVQHGYESNKNRGADYLCLSLARLGFKAVSIDAYKHGQRIEEPFVSQEDYLRYADAFNVVDRTSKDIIKIYEDIYSKDYDEFDLIGVSMGGFIAYMVSIYSDYVSKLVPVISTPHFEKLVTTRTDIDKLDQYKLEVEKILMKIKTMDPFNRIEDIHCKKMFITNGIKDEIIDYRSSEAFYKKIKHIDVQFKIYDCAHETGLKMQKDILEYIAEEKVVL